MLSLSLASPSPSRLSLSLSPLPLPLAMVPFRRGPFCELFRLMSSGQQGERAGRGGLGDHGGRARAGHAARVAQQLRAVRSQTCRGAAGADDQGEAGQGGGSVGGAQRINPDKQPRNFRDAMKALDKQAWAAPYSSEYLGFQQREVSKIVKPEPGVRIHDTITRLEQKEDNGEFIKCK
jgi:hypothetical protein